jgi:ankyrin repeat protein
MFKRKKKDHFMLKRYVALLVIGFRLTFCEDTIFDPAEAGHLDTVKEKIESDGFDPKDKNSYGEILLFYAARSGSLELVKYCVKKGVDPKATRKHGWTVLHSAAQSGSLETVQYLVRKWADPKATVGGWTVLEIAADSGSLDDTYQESVGWFCRGKPSGTTKTQIRRVEE